MLTLAFMHTACPWDCALKCREWYGAAPAEGVAGHEVPAPVAAQELLEWLEHRKVLLPHTLSILAARGAPYCAAG
jgi:hypothetical protein